MAETAPQLSSNSTSNLETSAVGEKEKPIRKDERRKDLEVIYHSGLNNPEVSILNLFAYLKLVVCLFEFICSYILVTNSLNLN